MKKILAIVVLGLLWCNVGFAKKVELDCKNGVMIKFGQEPERIYDEMNYIINLKDYSFVNKDLESYKQYFINVHEALIIYRFSVEIAQIGAYQKESGGLAFITAHYDNVDFYKNTKLKLDKINKQIPNYKGEKVWDLESYSVSDSGTTEQELEKFEIVRIAINLLGESNAKRVVTSEYQCNKLDLK